MEAESADGPAGSPAPKRLQLLEVAEQLAGMGSWEWQPELGVLVWSDNLYRIYGFEPGAVTPTPEEVYKLVHPDDRQRTVQYVERIRTAPHEPPLEYRIVQEGGRIRFLRSTIMEVERGPHGSARLVGVVQDITNEKLAQWEIAAHVAVVTALTGWRDFGESATEILRAMGEACEFAAGALWTREGQRVAPRAMWSRAGLSIPEFRQATFQTTLTPGEGLVGKAWASRRPEIMLDVTKEPTYARREAARASGLRGAMAIPAVHGAEVLAVLEFYAEDELIMGRLGVSTAAIGAELGAFFFRHRGQLEGPELTRREIEVLRSAAGGHTVAEIADELSIGGATVKTHLENIYRKLRAPDRAGAVARALRLGLFE